MAVLKEAREEQNTLLEGRSAAFTVQSEQKLVSKINSLQGKLEAIEDRLNRSTNQFSRTGQEQLKQPARAESQPPLQSGSPTEIMLEQERL